MERVKRDFFEDHPREVAPKLLGKYLIVNFSGDKIVTKVVETEAYGGKEDLGCHVGRFGRTKRTELLFGKAGCAYIYSVHINTHCLNVVCHSKGKAGGVLVRALEPILGIELILKNMGKTPDNFDIRKLLNGPGKLCRTLKVDKSLNGEDMVKGEKIYFTEGKNIEGKDILKTPRVNIPYAGICKRWLWRFVIKDSEFLSR